MKILVLLLGSVLLLGLVAAPALAQRGYGNHMGYGYGYNNQGDYNSQEYQNYSNSRGPGACGYGPGNAYTGQNRNYGNGGRYYDGHMMNWDNGDGSYRGGHMGYGNRYGSGRGGMMGW